MPFSQFFIVFSLPIITIKMNYLSSSSGLRVHFRVSVVTPLFLLLALCSYSQSTIHVNVAGNCDMCKANIESATATVPGVISADYDLDQNLLDVRVREDQFTLTDLGNALSQAGYDSDLATASQEVYDQLAACCQYRNFDDYDGSLYQITFDSIPSTEAIELSPFIKGTIYSQESETDIQPLIGATIQYVGRTAGGSTDVNGRFEIGRLSDVDQIIISYVGFQSDTIDISQLNEVNHVMGSTMVSDEVVISYRSNTTEISFVKPIQTHLVTEEELCKAACCSLSESFETSPAIDVSFTDAVTGTRQIQMLGLAGKYVQITRELIPDVRAIGVIQGLTLTPGPWISSINLSKGAGSVVNGFESMTGQINLELRKPEKKERVFLNLYANQGGRYEGNFFIRQKLSKNLSTAFLIHADDRQARFDRNRDGFLDIPLVRGFIGINRWKYQHENGLQAQLGVKYSNVDKVGGQVEYLSDLSPNSGNFWGLDTEMQKLEIWSKMGKVFNEEKNRSVGLQVSYTDHISENRYSRKYYTADHQSTYANLIYQTDLWNNRHLIKTGLSYQRDAIDETVLHDYESSAYERVESVPGTFAEYTYLPSPQFTLVAGLRLDHHNAYGAILTPRVHARYAINDNTVVRGVIGSGWRTTNPYAETPSIFASNRRIEIISTLDNTPYGLDRERSWNFGGNLTQSLNVAKSATLSLDYYYTYFDNQIIADFESRQDGTIIFADQAGQSSGHSAQAQMDVELIDRLDVRVAYRYNENTARFGDAIKTIALNPVHKAFINLAYETKGKWYFDFTLNWRGGQRLPDTGWLDTEYQLDEMTPSYFLANTQVRKFLTDDFEMYLGAENLFDFRLDNPIISADDPNSRNFEASYVWAPIFGRTIYFGLRYKLPYE